MEFQRNDGGRAEAGYKGETNDCVVRSICIATGLPYKEVYDAINVLAKDERPGKRCSRRSKARDGVWRKTYQRFLFSRGWKWKATMHIGSGCTVHLSERELPPGRLIVRVSGHVTAVIDGVVHDLYDPSRAGMRCVYGFYYKEA